MSSGFISETEIAEVRRKRQEEWDKVRTADQPQEAPEETYDPRSLFERLEEQKQRKELEYEEAHKLKNMIKGLDDDEVDFLDLVDRTKLQVERQQSLEEARELQDYRKRVATLQEKNLDQRLHAEILSKKPKVPPVVNRISQKKILSGVLVKKRKLSDSSEIIEDNIKSSQNKVQDNPAKKSVIHKNDAQTGLQCIGILPGLGVYRDTSDSEESSDSEICDKTEFDLLGRKVKEAKKAD